MQRGIVSAVLLVSVVAAAQGRLRLTTPEELRVGDRATVSVALDVPPGLPVLLTARHEGEAFEVVRARWMRSDAEDPEAATLRFGIPVVARAPGSGTLRVRVDTFRCDDEGRCTGETLEDAVTLEVLTAAPED